MKWLSSTESMRRALSAMGCPACVPAIGAILSAGLGFLINMNAEFMLLPL